ncbi:MAG TPA: L-threonylcarbamoyladenylate synthase [Synergistaceae bacterium]|nr:L-threonylcarbamoyladenylate synthase [Synergistaceae bacterium]HPQ37605.1 L-threonylcarbamoyladenylate synthase [Synergistaceae bacterium]
MTRIYRISPEFPEKNSEALKDAARVLQRGGLVAFPTETVYGLGANGLDPRGVQRIFDAKGRPGDNPLILHVESVEKAREIAWVDPRGEALFRRFSPGPLTLVFPSREKVPPVTRGNLATVAVRIPDSPIALELIRRCGLPVAAPSANSSGRPSPTDIRTVLEDLGEFVEVALDGGPTRVGIESTVLDVSTPVPILLRPGDVTLEDLRECLGEVLLPEEAEDLRKSPGTRYRHYAPRIPLYLWNPREGEALFLSLETRNCRTGYMGISSPPRKVEKAVLFEDVAHYARELYRNLRHFEEVGLHCIVAEIPEKTALGRALADRLRRAAGEEEKKDD